MPATPVGTLDPSWGLDQGEPVPASGPLTPSKPMNTKSLALLLALGVTAPAASAQYTSARPMTPVAPSTTATSGGEPATERRFYRIRR